MKAFFGLFLWLLSAVTVLAGSVRSFEYAEQDGTGKVWALNRGYRNEPLVAFEEGGWKGVPLPESIVPAAAEPISIVKLPDGAVAIFWRVSERDAIVTRHLGGESRRVARCALPIPQNDRLGPVFADSQNRLWITGLPPVIYRLEADGALKVVHTLAPGDAFLPSQGGSRSAHKKFNPLGVMEDGRGRFWLWSDSLRGYSNHLSLKGVLIVEGESVRLQKLGDLQQIVGLANAGPLGIWAASRKEGVCKVDPDSFEVTPVPPPEPGAFGFVSQLLLHGGEPMVVAAPDVEAKVSLWHFRNGQWRDWFASAQSDDERLERRYREPLGLLPVRNGLIVHSRRESPRFLAQGKPPVALDWKSGFPLRGARYAFNLPDGSLLIDGYHGKPQLPPKVNPSPRTVLIEARQHFFDPNDDFWWSSYEGENRLHRWSRGKVTQYPFPEGFRNPRMYPVESDGGRRLWVIPSKVEGQTALFDTRSKKWTLFPGIREAWQAQLGEPPRFPQRSTTRAIPHYSADGRQVAFYLDSSIHHFDGEAWRTLTKAEVGLPGIGSPFFEPEGALCLLYYGNVYRQVESGPWQKIGPIGREEDRQPRVPDFPEKKTFEPGAWPRPDSQGGYWFTSGGQLYRLRPGLPPVPVFEKGENHPFLAGGRAWDNHIHPEGWAFLSDGDQTVILAPKRPLPESTIAVTRKEGATARADFKSKTGVHFQWRLDGGEWQLTDQKSVRLENLSGGRHLVELVTLDKALQAQGKPAVAGFEVDRPVPPLVRVPPFTPEIANQATAAAEAGPEQVAGWIVALRDADYDQRKEAVANLARHRAAALPALRAALEKEEDPDRRWWLEAAIQQASTPFTP